MAKKTKVAHVHSWILSKRPGESKKSPKQRLFVCAARDCNSFQLGWQLEGKLAKCFSCGNSMEMSLDSLRLSPPVCVSCAERKKMTLQDLGKRPQENLSPTQKVVHRLFGESPRLFIKDSMGGAALMEDPLERIPDFSPTFEEIEIYHDERDKDE